MLVLTRRPHAGHESTITIGPDIEVTLVEVWGKEVRLSIAAPRDVPVHRQEVYAQIQQEGRKSGPGSE